MFLPIVLSIISCATGVADIHLLYCDLNVKIVKCWSDDPLVLASSSPNAGAQGQVTAEAGEAVVPAYTASDCLAYIYVAWILFIYSVGLGAEAASFYQVSRAHGRS